VLGDVYFADVRFIRFRIIVFIPVKKHYDIRILLDGAGFPEIGEYRPVVGTLLGSTGELG
jgi:hypothetical protein